MSPMTVAEKPIAAIIGRRISTGNGVHMIANHYRKGVRLDTHMHREAQLVYAAQGMMQVTTPNGRWPVPPDRAVWVPALLEHSIDVLADIEMRTLYFDLAWLARQHRSKSLDAEYVVRVSRRLHEAILALFDGRNDPSAPKFWFVWRCSNCTRRKIPRPSSRCRVSRAAAAPPTSCSAIPPAPTRSRPWRAPSGHRRGRCRGCSPRRRN
jgi:hypothetical protein